MSDSDPEGDKLDVKDLLGKCEDKLLKKKIQEEMEKERKQRRKKSKTVQREGRNSLSSKNIRETCASAMLVRNKPSMLSQSISKKEEIKLSSSKKISLGQRWKERRKEIEKKKIEQR